jgi:hypothetical protein
MSVNEHIVKFNWSDWKPSFSAFSGSKIDLFDKELDIVIGKRICTGYMKNKKKIECPDKLEVNDWKCNSCKLRDIFFMCMPCTGETCLNKKRRNACKKESYFIYLSVFGTLTKVGISQSYRLKQRLVEQGADFAAKIASVEDGKTVREIEQDIVKELGVTDRVRGKEKSKRLFTDPNESMKVLFAAITKLQNNGFNKHLIDPEIYDLRDFYKLDQIITQPVMIKVENGSAIKGTVVAAKGNIIVIEKDGKFLSFNAHDIIGRVVTGM